MHRLIAILLIACALVGAPAAHAWGPLGHRLVARLAEPLLTPPAHAEVQRLLATEGLDSLADVANWADDVRANDPVLGKQSAKWHYINIGEYACTYDAARACPGGDCVVEAIRAQVAILGDRSRSDAERLQALKFLVHFVGDVHQPMHAGYARDRGGNTVQLQLGGKGTNLHAVWDSRLLASARLDEDAYVDTLRLEGERLPADTGPYVPAAPAVWAEQSCRIAMAPGVYPQGAKIDDAYLQQYRPTAEAQVQAGGARLARLLDDALR
ncbi:S1/P1 nuclease [Luteimonas viscosa]|uniref:S1/P1 nuclease n=1 Tax=Luteimonas viscosa TaxID=1132694 RepID=A0A5D4XM82_9GAMM|nr:S1/P1 nuclease [Luteimonas viscosa]TYT25777.1 S1/P1 nuclease [Luteimonas viscosa]